MPTATAPTMKRGSAVLVNDTSRSASTREHRPSLRRRAVIRAPMGYPDASPMARAKAPTPGTLNSGRIKGSSKAPMKWTTPRPISVSEAMKNGSSAGKTMSHHTRSPSSEALYDTSGNAMIAIVTAEARAAVTYTPLLLGSIRLFM
ncbi:MAG: hypothetical protein BWY92_00544 [Firmicutes bacterium ADurb.BinA052]|nr:MAG: hypothetical protein BWY92_00544 [Firmicutes bacterium ADurb.BinA052]